MASPIQKFWKGTEYNDAAHLGVEIDRPEIVGEWHARAVAVHLLTKQENGGNHNLYMDVINDKNEQLRLSLVRGLNTGNQANLYSRVDKPNDEFGTNFVMHRQDTLNCWVEEASGFGRVTSDVAKGFNTRWGGETVGGQDYGHISYYVIWQIQKGGSVPQPEPNPTLDDYNQGFSDGYKEAKAKVLEFINKL